MTYELALKLKNAGFPQATKAGNQIPKPGMGAIVDIDKKGKNIPIAGEWAYAPTLSELIEACGEGYFKLAHGQDDWYGSMGLDNEKHSHGSTPEEAVANLWLALNKK